MTNIPKAPGSDDPESESDELFELDDADFQPVEPSGKIKRPQDLSQPTPRSTGTIQIVTGEVETTPVPQQAPVPPPAASPAADLNRGGKGARQALQDALLQLQKNKQSGLLPNEPSGASAAPLPPQNPASPLPPRGLTGPPPPSSTPKQATPLARPLPPEPTPRPGLRPLPPEPTPGPSLRPLPPEPTPTHTTRSPTPEHTPTHVTRSPSFERTPTHFTQPPVSEPTPTHVTRPLSPESAPPRALRPLPPEPTPVTARSLPPEEELTPLPGPAPWQAAVTSEVELMPPQEHPSPPSPQAEVPEPAGIPEPQSLTPTPVTKPSLEEQARPTKDRPFHKPLLTPVARGPAGAGEALLSQTTESVLSEAMSPAATAASAPPLTEPTAPSWMTEAPPEEAPSMMDFMPTDERSTQAAHMASDVPATEMPAEDRPAPAAMVLEETLSVPHDASITFESLTSDANAAVGARATTEPMPHLTPQPAPSAKVRLKRAAPLAAGILALLCVTGVLIARHRVIAPPVKVVQAPPPVVAKAPPHKDKVHAPKPVVPPVTETLSIDNVDRLGYHALAAGVETLAGSKQADPGLLAWARWRLALRFEDAAAKEALAQELDGLPLRGRVDLSNPLLVAAHAGAAMTSGRYPLAKRLIVALAKSPVTKTRWQTWYIQTMWQSRRPIPPARMLLMLDRILKVAPANADVRLWRAEVMMRRSPNEGVRVMTDLARRKDPDTIALIARVFARMGLMQALLSALEPLDDGSVILQAAPAHQADLLRVFTASRVLRGDYEAPRNIAEALARGDGDAHAVTVWARLTRYEGDDPGTVLQQGIDAQSDKAVRGWLLYEAVRLALDRHDSAHAKFLADGMNSMPPGDIGAYAPLAAARVELANNAVQEAKHHIANAVAMDAKNRDVQIAQALDASTPEVAIRWEGEPPTPPEILWQQAHATAVAGQGAVAARMAEELFWRDPTLLDPVVLLSAWSGWLDQAGEALRAESLLERIAPALPDDDRPVIQLIKQARRGKRYDAAVQWYEVLLKRRPSDPELTVQLAKTYIDAQKPEVAARVLHDAEHADPNVRTPAFMTTMASALSKSDPPKARQLVAVALRVQPSADSYVLLADMENAAGHPEEELRALQAALPLAPDDGELHLRVATLLRDKRQSNQAMALLQPLTNDAAAMEMLGDLLQESGDLPDALIAYQRSDTAYQRGDGDRTDQAGLLVKMAVLQLDGLHNGPAAIKTLQKAVSVAPRHAETFYWLSRAFGRTGMRSVSKKLLLKYLRLAPDGTRADEVRRELAAWKRGRPATGP